MTREEFIKQYPTPGYVVETWNAIHNAPGLNMHSMGAWEAACRKARAEADAAYDALGKNGPD